MLSAAAAIAVAGALVLADADRTVFDADGFVRRAAAALQTDAVRAVAARRVRRSRLPPVHARHADGEAKVRIDNLEVIDNTLGR